LFPGEVAEQTLQTSGIPALLSPDFDTTLIVQAEKQAIPDFEAQPVPDLFGDSDLSFRGERACGHWL
jgi:hypothetical protein